MGPSGKAVSGLEINREKTRVVICLKRRQVRTFWATHFAGIATGMGSAAGREQINEMTDRGQRFRRPRFSGEPDPGNLHVRFDEGTAGRDHRRLAAVLYRPNSC